MTTDAFLPDEIRRSRQTMPAIYEYLHTVQPHEIDGMGHANNLHFLKWMQDAAVAHSSAQGWPPERYEQIGAGWVVRSHTIEYRRPAFSGDVITVHTWVADFRKIRSLRRYRTVRPSDNTVLAVAATDWTFVGRQHGTPRRVPRELIDAFQLISDQHEPPARHARPRVG